MKQTTTIYTCDGVLYYIAINKVVCIHCGEDNTELVLKKITKKSKELKKRAIIMRKHNIRSHGLSKLLPSCLIVFAR